jgi:hypothetical protein
LMDDIALKTQALADAQCTETNGLWSSAWGIE